MQVKGNRLFVVELKKDMVIDGLLQRYDDTNPFMLARVESIGDGIDINEIPNYTDKIILTSRGNKIPFKGGYFVEEQYILAVLSEEEYNNL